MKTVKCDKCGRVAETQMDAMPWVDLEIDVRCNGNAEVDTWRHSFEFDLCDSCKKEYIDSVMSIISSLLVK